MSKAQRYAPAAILLLGCALLAYSRTQEAAALDAPLSGVLASWPGYQAFDQRVSDEERRVAGMTDYVARAFVRDSAVAFTTLVAYYDRQTQGKTIHSPRNCLPGAGWEIVRGGSATVMVAGRPRVVNRYVLRNDKATALAYYWYQGRGRITANEYAVKWNLLRDAALIGRTEEALVRVVVPVTMRASAARPASEDAAFARADSIGRAVSSRLAADIQRVLPPPPAASQRIASRPQV